MFGRSACGTASSGETLLMATSRRRRLLIVTATALLVACGGDEPRDPMIVSDDGTAIVDASTLVLGRLDGSTDLTAADLADPLLGPCDPCDDRALTADTRRLVVAWPRTPCQNEPLVAVSSDETRLVVDISIGPERLVDGDCDAVIVEGAVVIALAEVLGVRGVAIVVRS